MPTKSDRLDSHVPIEQLQHPTAPETIHAVDERVGFKLGEETVYLNESMCQEVGMNWGFRHGFNPHG